MFTKCAKFVLSDVEKETYNAFKMPATLTIPDIKSSPGKRRVSVEGTITEVSDKKNKKFIIRYIIFLHDLLAMNFSCTSIQFNSYIAQVDQGIVI